MKVLRLLFFLIVVAVFIYAVPEVLAVDSVQGGEYQRARALLKGERLEEALNVFTKLANDNPSDFNARMGVIDTTLEQARVLKADKNPAWKYKLRDAFGDLKRIYRGHTTSPEIYLLFAKSYWINNRLRKAERSLQKAFYYKPNYTEAIILSGDMYLEYGKKTDEKMDFMDEEDEDNLKRDFARFRSGARSSFEKALTRADADTETRTMLYYKLGNTYYELYGNKVKAKELWSRAVSTAPASVWGRRAQEKLLASK